MTDSLALLTIGRDLNPVAPLPSHALWHQDGGWAYCTWHPFFIQSAELISDPNQSTVPVSENVTPRTLRNISEPCSFPHIWRSSCLYISLLLLPQWTHRATALTSAVQINQIFENIKQAASSRCQLWKQLHLVSVPNWREPSRIFKYSFNGAACWSALKALVSHETLPPEYILLLQLNQRRGIKHPECSHMLTELQSKLCQLVWRKSDADRWFSSRLTTLACRQKVCQVLAFREFDVGNSLKHQTSWFSAWGLCVRLTDRWQIRLFSQKYILGKKPEWVKLNKGLNYPSNTFWGLFPLRETWLKEKSSIFYITGWVNDSNFPKVFESVQ